MQLNKIRADNNFLIEVYLASNIFKKSQKKIWRN